MLSYIYLKPFNIQVSSFKKPLKLYPNITFSKPLNSNNFDSELLLLMNLPDYCIAKPRTLLLSALFVLNGQVGNAQIEQLMETARSKNKVKTQTAYQRNYKGSMPQGQEFKLMYTEYTEAGKKALEKTFDATPELLKQYTATYTDSKLVKEIWKAEVTDSAIYKYDAANHLDEEHWYFGGDKSRSKIYHYYNAEGKLVCTVNQYNYGKIVDSVFYDNDRLALVRNFDESGQLNSNTTHIDDHQGHPMEEIKTNAEGEMLQKTTRTYYESGLIKSLQTSQYANWDTKNKGKDVAYSQSIEAYKYEKGQLHEQINVSVNNNEKVMDTQTIYTFDEKGLLTEMVVINLLTKEKNVVRYTYTYYP